MHRKRTERPLPYRDTFSRLNGLKQEQKLHFRHKDREFTVPFPSHSGRGPSSYKCSRRYVDI